MVWIYLSLGPLFLLMAILYKMFPPKHPNYLYGYRTARSMRDEESWRIANEMAATGMLIWAVIMNVVQALSTVIFGIYRAAIIFSVGLLAGIVAMVALIERHLAKRSVM